MKYISKKPVQYKTQIVDKPSGFEYVICEPGYALNSEKMFSGRTRFETITDVKFITDNLMVAGHRDHRMLYLFRIDFEKKTAHMLDRISLKFDGRTPLEVTLIGVDGMRLYLTFISYQIGVVDIVNNKLVMRGRMAVSSPTKGYHGISFHPTKPITYLSTSQNDPGLVVLNRSSNLAHTIQLAGMEGFRLKQTRVLGPYIVVSGTTGNISDTDLYFSYDGYVGVFKQDTFECVDLLHLPNSQMDDLVVYNDHIYFVRQGSEPYGEVFQYTLENDKLVKKNEYRVGEFPHGLDIRNGWIACTSMKNSSIQFFRV